MFKVEVTYGSDPIAQAALNRRVHDRLIEEVFNGRNLDVLDEAPSFRGLSSKTAWTRVASQPVFMSYKLLEIERIK